MKKKLSFRIVVAKLDNGGYEKINEDRTVYIEADSMEAAIVKLRGKTRRVIRAEQIDADIIG